MVIEKVQLLECSSASGRRADQHVFWLHTRVRWADLRRREEALVAERGEDLTLFVFHTRRGDPREECASPSMKPHAHPNQELERRRRAMEQAKQAKHDVGGGSGHDLTHHEADEVRQRRPRRQWTVAKVRVLKSSLFEDKGDGSIPGPTTGVVGGPLLRYFLGQFVQDCDSPPCVPDAYCAGASRCSSTDGALVTTSLMTVIVPPPSEDILGSSTGTVHVTLPMTVDAPHLQAAPPAVVPTAAVSTMPSGTTTPRQAAPVRHVTPLRVVPAAHPQSGSPSGAAGGGVSARATPFDKAQRRTPLMLARPLTSDGARRKSPTPSRRVGAGQGADAAPSVAAALAP